MATIQLPWAKVFEKLIDRQLEIEREKKELESRVVAYERKGLKKWFNKSVSDEDLLYNSLYAWWSRVRCEEKWEKVEVMIRMCVTASSEDSDAMIAINNEEYQLIWGE